MVKNYKEIMLGRILPILVNVPTEMLGTVFDLISRLVDDKGQETWKNLKHLLRGEFEVKLPPFIKWIGTTTTSATTEKFVAKEKFRKDSKEVKSWGFYGTFGEDFLSGDGKIEEPLDEQILRYGDLSKTAKDLPAKDNDIAIIPELDDEAAAETTLVELHDMLKKQGNGEEGALLTNGYGNIFYIRNSGGVLRAVDVDWRGDGWRVFADSVEDPHGWGAGCRVFSRNS